MLLNFLDPTMAQSSAELDAMYELSRCATWVKEVGATKICLQFPDHLLVDSFAVSQALYELTGRSFYILGDTSYGSCCVDLVAAQHAPSDGMIHFGPACFSFTRPGQDCSIPILYVLPKDMNISSLTETLLPSLPSRKDSILISSCEYFTLQDQLCTLLREHWPDVGVISSRYLTGEVGSQASPGSVGHCSKHCTFEESVPTSQHQIKCLGRGFCLPPNKTDFSAYNIIYVGIENSFLHALLASPLAHNTTITCLSPQGEQFTPENDCSHVKKRQHYLAQQVREAAKVGLVLASPGDPLLLQAEARARKLLSLFSPPKRVYSFSVGKPNPAKLANFAEIDVFVLLACPQHPLLSPASSKELSKEYYRPIVSLSEVEVAVSNSSSACGPDFHDCLPGGLGFTEQSSSEVGELCKDVEALGSVSKPSSALIERGTFGLVSQGGGAWSLSERSWQGLDPSLGSQAPALVTQGCRGIAAKYVSEPKNPTPE